MHHGLHVERFVESGLLEVRFERMVHGAWTFNRSMAKRKVQWWRLRILFVREQLDLGIGRVLYLWWRIFLLCRACAFASACTDTGCLATGCAIAACAIASCAIASCAIAVCSISSVTHAGWGGAGSPRPDSEHSRHRRHGVAVYMAGSWWRWRRVALAWLLLLRDERREIFSPVLCRKSAASPSTASRSS